MNQTIARLIQGQKEKEQKELGSWLADRAKLQDDLSRVQSKIDELELSMSELDDSPPRDPATGRFIPIP